MDNTRLIPPFHPLAADRIPEWGAAVLSDVTPEFVDRLDAGVGDLLTVRLHVPATAPVRAVEIRRIRDGAHHRVAMDHDGDGRWRGTLAVDGEGPLHWHFILQTDRGPYFYTQLGMHSVPPTEDHDFVHLPAATVPEWVAGAVFYQIFPDRFAKGDPNAGRRPAEYEFDGGHPLVLDWDQEPLEFADGRCQDFFNGDLEGIRQRLDYLQDLGVTAVYVTPIFAARTTHRYDCIDYRSVDEALGGDAALERLATEMHARGMRLVVDVSINHTGSDHPWFRRAQDDPDSREAAFYYHNDDGSVAFWHGVPTLPQLNYTSTELRDEIWGRPDAVVRRWLRDPWRIDGWRFDVANQTGRRGRDQFGHEIWRAVRRAVKETNPEAWIVGEHWEDAVDYLLGDQWDGAMNYVGCGSPLRRWAGELSRFEHDYPHYPPRSAAAEGGRTFGGRELAQMIVQHGSRLAGAIQHSQLNVLDTHDIHRVHHHREVFSWEIYRGIVMLQFLLPGAPSIWYGDEVGLAGHARSVEGCRYPMEWDPARWDRRFRTLYRTLARLKSGDPAMRTGAFRVIAADDESLVAARISVRHRRAFLLVLNRRADRGTVAFSPGPLVRPGELFGDGGTATFRDVIPRDEDPVVVTPGRVSVPLEARRSRLLRIDYP